jgi:hypothetical protein
MEVGLGSDLAPKWTILDFLSVHYSGDHILHVENGVCTFNEGQSLSPTLIIHTPSEVWLAVSCGKMDGQAALM